MLMCTEGCRYDVCWSVILWPQHGPNHFSCVIHLTKTELYISIVKPPIILITDTLYSTPHKTGSFNSFLGQLVAILCQKHDIT